LAAAADLNPPTTAHAPLPAREPPPARSALRRLRRSARRPPLCDACAAARAALRCQIGAPGATLCAGCADCRAPLEGGGGASLVEDYTGCPTLSEILRILSVKRRRRGRTSMPGSPTTSSKSYRRFRYNIYKIVFVYVGSTDESISFQVSTHQPSCM
uniref:Uncharacterized protein n=1 Tax=Aegilops tauschii subsp. strangulata TaxID=200361 RepID=A0A453SG66_AEGTS